MELRQARKEETDMRRIFTVALMGSAFALAACGGNTEEAAVMDETGAMADTTFDTSTTTTDPTMGGMAGDPAADGAMGADTTIDDTTGMDAGAGAAGADASGSAGDAGAQPGM